LNTTTKTKLLAALGMGTMITLLAACSSEPSPWTKQQSPWEQRRESMQAPAADVYKDELASVDQGSEPTELSYQAEQVGGYAPGVMEPVPEESAAMMEPEPAPVAAPRSMTPEQEIMNQPASYYTIQVIASVDVDRVYKFAEQNQLSIRYVVPTQRDGVTWHVLLLDVYPDYASAQAAMQEVASTLPTKPWIRKVGSVQKLLR
jgi:septal ring-binding cell division protein DamX